MVKSVLGKLIQREFGKERYACYADKLKRKQSMDVFCDIYEKLSHSSEEELDLALKGLLDTVQQSIGISRNFIYIVTGFAVTVLTLVFLQLPAVVFAITAVTAGLIFLYKTCEFVKNRYCDRDIRIVLIYKKIRHSPNKGISRNQRRIYENREYAALAPHCVCADRFKYVI